jgi:Raf kinase inhibitor-like YbhB/YbcL family protein
MADDFRLTSPDFEAGSEIPRRFTCDGEDVSPALEWTGVPDGAQALTLVMDDPDARGFVHWIVLDMTATHSGALPRGFAESPDAPPQGMNDFDRLGYGGPCPPSGTHRYLFTLYALEEPLGLVGSPGGDEVRAALARRVMTSTSLEARYTRSR